MLLLYLMNENPQNIIAKLHPYVSARRQQRIEEVLNNRLMSIQVALEMPADIHNAFAVIRSCEIFGVAKLHIIAPEKIVSGIRPISKGALDWVDISFYKDTNDFLAEIGPQNFRLAGAIPNAAQNIQTIPIEEPLCLFLGNEHSGLSPVAKQACDWHYQIPMFGMTESLNLSVAAAISLYETTQRKRNNLQKTGDLTAADWKKLQAQYFLNSVNVRLANALLREIPSKDHR